MSSGQFCWIFSNYPLQFFYHLRVRNERVVFVCRMTLEEAPFYPREKLVQKQQYFQKLSKHIHLKGRYDVVTSVAIPLALAGTSLFMIVSSKSSLLPWLLVFFDIASAQSVTHVSWFTNRVVGSTTCLTGLGKRSEFLSVLLVSQYAAWQRYRPSYDVFFVCK